MIEAEADALTQLQQLTTAAVTFGLRSVCRLFLLAVCSRQHSWQELLRISHVRLSITYTYELVKSEHEAHLGIKLEGAMRVAKPSVMVTLRSFTDAELL